MIVFDVLGIVVLDSFGDVLGVEFEYFLVFGWDHVVDYWFVFLGF